MRDLTINDRLVFAANAYDFRLVRERVLAGADVNYVEPKKGTPLYAAVGDVQCVITHLSLSTWLVADTRYQHQTTRYRLILVSVFIDESLLPNKLDAVNPAIASVLQSDYHWRGVTDPER